MQLYRFSPITREEDLMAAISYIHQEAHRLCQDKLGKILPVTGSLAIFTHYDNEFTNLIEIRNKLTGKENFNQKYFKLHEPLTFAATDTAPAATYHYLYIREPDPYRAQVGDIDFVMNKTEHTALQQRLEAGEKIPGVRPSPLDHLELIELYDPDIDVLSYIDTLTMAELIQSK